MPLTIFCEQQVGPVGAALGLIDWVDVVLVIEVWEGALVTVVVEAAAVVSIAELWAILMVLVVNSISIVDAPNTSN